MTDQQPESFEPAIPDWTQQQQQQQQQQPVTTGVPDGPSPRRGHRGLKIAGGVAGAIILIGVLASLGGGGSKKPAQAIPDVTTTHAGTGAAQHAAGNPYFGATSASPTSTTITPPATPAPTHTPTETVSQRAAVQSAQSYLEMGGFSRAGLIDQLDSTAGDGFSKADATYAVNHVTVDWNAQALDSAKSYMEMGGFSRAGLLEQLTSSAGDQFTQAQAEYAVNHVGL